MTSVPETQFKWHDGLNGVWLLEDCEGVATRAGVERLYALLVANKEISSLMTGPAAETGPGQPDFEVEAPSVSDLEEQIATMLAAQLELARSVCAEDPFCIALAKRLAVLRRVFHAVRYKHNEQAKQVCDLLEPSAQPLESHDWPERTGSGSQALVEMGVMTGLTLMFALLKNTWKQPDSVGLADDVMQTAIDIVGGLPPLTLANESQLTALGVRGLDQVSAFLRTAALPESGATPRGQLLAVELLLALAVQRGSLGPVLDWIRLALAVSTATPGASLRWAVLAPALQRIRQAPVTPVNHANERPDEASVPAYRAGILLLEEVSALACELDPARETAAASTTAASCQVFVCGSNSSHQVGEESQEKILVPRLARAFEDVGQVEAGQYCSFVVHTDGSLSACGKGSYGRLGLGDSSNQPQPRRVDIDGAVRYVSSSKGSDGHSLALTVDGRVFSWGDGDYGKLGHGNCTTQKQPRQVGGALAGRQVRAVHAGYRHSAAVTIAGELFTWGEGEHGRLGHGNCTSRNSPTQVQDLRQVGEVSCGQSHTIVVSADCRTVWTFGSGEYGKLGHGDTQKLMRPRVVEALQGVNIAKVAAGSQFSLALTATGQLYSWGFGSCLGQSPRDVTIMLPTLMEDLVGLRLVDVVIGDSHVLALTQDYQVFAWGNNTMGQCGLGQCASPVTRPQSMQGLDGIPVRQISAGTSHSVVWTAPPAERPVVAWHRPFCVDLATPTFARLRAQLEALAAQFDAAPLPFGSRAEHHGFVGRLLALLRAHLRLALAAGVAGSVLAGEAAPLRQLLFRLLDVDAPGWLEAAVSECLAVGAAVLLPPLPERMQLLHALLPDRPQRSKGQRALLSLVLRSLDAPAHVTALLCAADLAQAGQLMSTVLAALTQQALTQLGGDGEGREEPRDESEALTEPLHSLLTALRTHLLAFCTDQLPSKASLALLHSHAELVLASALMVSETATATLEISGTNRQSATSVNDMLMDSVAGCMLGQLLAALVLLPVENVQNLLPRLLDLMQPLQNLSTSLLKANSSLNCDWLLDAHLTTCLLVGRCLGSRLIGPPPSPLEAASSNWLRSPLLANGLEDSWYEPREARVLLEEWAIDKDDKDDEKADCYSERECSPSEAALLVELLELASLSDWDPVPTTSGPATSPLALATRLALLALLKHCRLEPGDVAARRQTVDVVFPAVLDLRRKLLAARAPPADADDADTDYLVRVSVIEAKHLAWHSIELCVRVKVGELRRKITNSSRNNDSPYFNESFVFEFKSTLEELEERVIELAVLQGSRYNVKSKVLCSALVDVGTVWKQPGHQFHQKWAELLDRSDIEAGSKGYLKVDLSVLARGEKVQTPATTSVDEDEDDVGIHLLAVDTTALVRRKVRYLVRVYCAELVPPSGRKAVPIHAYVKATFAGNEGRTSVRPKTISPEWNEQIAFTDVFPSLCQRVKIEVRNNATRVTLGAFSIDIATVSRSSEGGFLPTFGPCFVPLYSPHKDDAGAFRGQLLVALVADTGSARTGTSDAVAQVSSIQPPTRKQLPKNEQFLVFGALYSVFLLHPKTALMNLHVEITWVGDGDGENAEENEDDEQEPRRLSCTEPMMSRLASRYAYLDIGRDKPCISLHAQLPDTTRRTQNATWLAHLSHSLRSKLCEWRAATNEGVPESVRSLSSLLDVFSCEWQTYLAWARQPWPRATPLDAERAKLAAEVTRHLAATSHALASTPNAAMAEAAWANATRVVAMLEFLAADPQTRLPDILIWLVNGSRRLAVSRLPSTELLDTVCPEARGRHAGRLQTLLLRSTSSLPEADGPIFGALEIAIWMGVNRPAGRYLAELPPGWSLAGQPSNAVPSFLRYPRVPPLRIRVHVQRAQFPPGSDKSALADPCVRAAFPGITRETRVVSQSLDPVWDQTLALDDVSTHHAPTLALVVVDKDRHGYEFMGLALLRVDPSLESVALQSFSLWNGTKHAGELLAAVEVLASDSVTADDTLPSHVRLHTTRYRLDVYFWGVRDVARLRALPVDHAQVTIRIGNIQLVSTRLAHGVLNFTDPVASAELELPEDEFRLPPLTISVADWRLGRAVAVGGHTMRSARTLLFPLLTSEESAERRAETLLQPAPPEPGPCETVFCVVGGPQLRKDTSDEDFPALAECYTKHKPPVLTHVTEPLFPPSMPLEGGDVAGEDSDSGEENTRCCCFKKKPKEIPPEANEEEDEVYMKEVDDRPDWWTKYHSSRLTKNEAPIKFYPNELEEQPEFGRFQDWLRSFPLQRGKLAAGQDTEHLRVGTFKGCVRLYRWPSERRVTPWGADVERDSFAGLPRNGPAELLVRLYVVKATGLHPKDASGKADPFLEVVLGGKTWLNDPSSAIPRQLDPVFGCCVEMSAVLPADSVLTVRVMDRDRLSAADLMGETHIDIENRFWSNHRATCGLASRYDETGLNRWRDSSRPRQILAELCRRTGTSGPVYRGGSVVVGSIAIGAGCGDLPPEGQADSALHREELALAVLRRWHKMPLCGVSLVPEHVETRSLFSPQFPGIEQGKLHLWVDLFPASEALNMQPVIDITPRTAESFELRIVLWNMEDVPLTESDFISGKQKTDIYVKAWMLGSDDEQVSDVHYNSLTGEGKFNWRFVFPFSYLSSEQCMVVKRREGFETSEFKQPCKLFLQVWDNDVVSKDDFIGSLTFELNKMPRCVPTSSNCSLEQLEQSKQRQFNLFRQKRARGWWPFMRIDEDCDRDLAGKMEAEIQLVTAEEAAKHPVGLGRREPDALPMPERPESSLRWFVNPLKALQTLVCRGLKMPICLILVVVLIVAFILYYIFCIPNALAKRTVDFF